MVATQPSSFTPVDMASASSNPGLLGLVGKSPSYGNFKDLKALSAPDFDGSSPLTLQRMMEQRLGADMHNVTSAERGVLHGRGAEGRVVAAENQLAMDAIALGGNSVAAQNAIVAVETESINQAQTNVPGANKVGPAIKKDLGMAMTFPVPRPSGF